MASKVISGAVLADAQICNLAEPPSAGIHVGGGLHVIIPPDWAARCAAGQSVPGCTYASVAPDGSLMVDDIVQAQILVPAVRSGLPTGALTAFESKLSVAAVTSLADQVATAEATG